MKEGIALPFQDTPDRGWLPDGSRVSWLNAPSGKKEDRLPVRVTEHPALVPGPDGEEEASETCTLITTLPDHEAVPAGKIQEAYLTRWSASETTFGENKATIAGAGNRTSGPVLRSGCPQLVLQEAWAWLTAARLVRAGAAASLPQRGGRRPRAAPRGREARHRRRGILHRRPHYAIRSIETTQVTAVSSLQAIAAAAGAAARAHLHTLNIPGRERHSPRVQKARPKFGHTSATKKTLTGKHQVIVYAPGRC
jgi:hypothetical protein